MILQFLIIQLDFSFRDQCVSMRQGDEICQFVIFLPAGFAADIIIHYILTNVDSVFTIWRIGSRLAAHLLRPLLHSISEDAFLSQFRSDIASYPLRYCAGSTVKGSTVQRLVASESYSYLCCTTEYPEAF